MPRGNELSEFERGEIIGLKKANFSYRQLLQTYGKKIITSWFSPGLHKAQTSTLLKIFGRI